MSEAAGVIKIGQGKAVRVYLEELMEDVEESYERTLSFPLSCGMLTLSFSLNKDYLPAMGLHSTGDGGFSAQGSTPSEEGHGGGQPPQVPNPMYPDLEEGRANLEELPIPVQLVTPGTETPPEVIKRRSSRRIRPTGPGTTGIVGLGRQSPTTSVAAQHQPERRTPVKRRLAMDGRLVNRSGAEVESDTITFNPNGDPSSPVPSSRSAPLASPHSAVGQANKRNPANPQNWIMDATEAADKEGVWFYHDPSKRIGYLAGSPHPSIPYIVTRGDTHFGIHGGSKKSPTAVLIQRLPANTEVIYNNCFGHLLDPCTPLSEGSTLSVLFGNGVEAKELTVADILLYRCVVKDLVKAGDAIYLGVKVLHGKTRPTKAPPTGMGVRTGKLLTEPQLCGICYSQEWTFKRLQCRQILCLTCYKRLAKRVCPLDRAHLTSRGAANINFSKGVYEEDVILAE